VNYDLSKFHPACGDKQLMFGPDGISVYCPKCQVIANVEAIASKISPADACKAGSVVRAQIGDNSPNVSKGEVIS
jgi:hypothetical protein